HLLGRQCRQWQNRHRGRCHGPHQDQWHRQLEQLQPDHHRCPDHHRQHHPQDVSLSSITAPDKVYDGNNTATITSGAISTGVGSETL
ncbi:Uncharacterized protein APZ42_005930, partial [Daphnia magna]